MVLSRWDPVSEMTSLREAVNRLLEESVVRPGTLLGGRTGALLDVYEENDHYVVEVALPGVRPADVEVTVLGNTVTIRGEWPARPEGRRYLHAERGTGRFERTVTLPNDVDADKAQAHAENGVLRLTLPKVAVARPRRIALQA
ncbi:MAG TPA: Hsp20/alpha crystallin family protein [Chloroflexota bacterium]|nr:Hsp20/alpha crystallin family protein [Chloroflexota bacterium]